MPYAVVTRDADEAAAYAAALAPLGLEAIAMPVTREAPPVEPEALARALAAPHDLVVCASARAARALGRGGTTTSPIFAVGPATLRALEAAGLAATVPPAVRDGATLAQALIARGVAGLRILVPRAEDGRDEAIELLRAAGAEVLAVIAYRTVATAPDDPSIMRGRELLVAGLAAICAVFAPSQVAALDRIAPVATLRTRFVAIGETTAAALREAGVAVGVADTPTPEGMARAVGEVYSPST